ncbi:MAG: hypothetical protein PUC36_01005 [Clostridiales bacterium]|nr:hypothetical protein [Clostridiales bacterium]
MYNPYLHHQEPRDEETAPSPPEAEKKGLSGLLKSLRLEELDTGDVLLLLILLFLFLDDRENNLELLMTLGLMLIL